MVYNVPLGAAPMARVGGGIRGTEEKQIVFTVLAPEQTGYTTKEQPSLYWYQSQPAENMEFELTLNSGDETIMEIRLSRALNTSVQKFDIAALNVSLETDQLYEWVIALVPDPDDRARDLTLSTFLKRMVPPDNLSQKLQQASETEHPYIYAKEGIWYEALEGLNHALEATPNDKTLALDRIKLFEQVGLEDVANLEQDKLSQEK